MRSPGEVTSSGASAWSCATPSPTPKLSSLASAILTALTSSRLACVAPSGATSSPTSVSTGGSRVLSRCFWYPPSSSRPGWMSTSRLRSGRWHPCRRSLRWLAESTAMDARDTGALVVFDPLDGSQPPGEYTTGTSVTRSMLADGHDPLNHRSTRRYFELFLSALRFPPRCAPHPGPAYGYRFPIGHREVSANQRATPCWLLVPYCGFRPRGHRGSRRCGAGPSARAPSSAIHRLTQAEGVRQGRRRWVGR